MLKELQGWMVGVCLCLMVASGRGVSQVASSDTADALRDLAKQASVIFAGQVISITRKDASGFVDVRFGVETAILGCPGAAEYVVREWAGLWVGHAPRYRVGARLLMLLYAPGPSGMSAPVGGMDGVIPLVGAGSSPVMDASGSVPADSTGSVGLNASSSFAADMRWVQTNASRASATVGVQASTPVVVQPLAPVQLTRTQPGGSSTTTRYVSGRPVQEVASDVGLSGTTSALPTLDTVLSFLRAANGQR